MLGYEVRPKLQAYQSHQALVSCSDELDRDIAFVVGVPRHSARRFRDSKRFE